MIIRCQERLKYLHTSSKSDAYLIALPIQYLDSGSAEEALSSYTVYILTFDSRSGKFSLMHPLSNSLTRILLRKPYLDTLVIDLHIDSCSARPFLIHYPSYFNASSFVEPRLHTLHISMH